MSNPIDLKKREDFHFEYRGVNCKIHIVKRGDMGGEYPHTAYPCAYIFLNDMMFSDIEEFEKLWACERGSEAYNTFVGRCDWHGGISWWQREQIHGPWDGWGKDWRWRRSIEVGCDWNHIFDEGTYPDEWMAVTCLQKVIDTLHDMGVLNTENER